MNMSGLIFIKMIKVQLKEISTVFLAGKSE